MSTDVFTLAPEKVASTADASTYRAANSNGNVGSNGVDTHTNGTSSAVAAAVMLDATVDGHERAIDGSNT